MTTLAPDTRRQGIAGGLALAIPSAIAFGMSGSLARSLMEAGWTAGAATLCRVLVATLALLVPGVRALHGDWGLIRRNVRPIVAYGVFAVAGAQLCYFLAVSYLQVGVALLIEYTAPVAVVLWMWGRHGHRPGILTAVGAALAAVGLVLLLDVFGGGPIQVVGVAWALGAMVGAAIYFVISADDSSGLPPITLAAAGLLVAFVALGLAGLVGVLPLTASTSPAQFAGFEAPWWVVVLWLGLVTAALAYVLGIAASRRLGPRLASFVALTEVLAALLFAWLLLAEAPAPVQLLGAALVVAGVVVVKLGEPQAADLQLELPDGHLSGAPPR